LVNKSVQIKKKTSPGLLRTSLSAKVTKRTISSPTSNVSTPTSRVGKRVITPSPKVRDNANTNSVLTKPKSNPNLRPVSGLNGKKHRISLEESFAKNIEVVKGRRGSQVDGEIRHPLANKKNA